MEENSCSLYLWEGALRSRRATVVQPTSGKEDCVHGAEQLFTLPLGRKIAFMKGNSCSPYLWEGRLRSWRGTVVHPTYEKEDWVHGGEQLFTLPLGRKIALMEGNNCSPYFWEGRLRSWRGTLVYPTSGKDGLRNIGNSMSMVLDTKKSNFGINNAYGFIFSALWHFITKCDRHY